MNISGIYIIINTKNGKIYIGQAINIRKRWQVHKWKLCNNQHPNKHLQFAWNKYGQKVFKFKILERCSVSTLDEREQHYLDIYVTKDNCYNIAQYSTSPNKGIKANPETIRKISKGNKGKKRSQEVRTAMSIRMKNRTITEETRKKMSESAKKRKGRVMSEETRKKISSARKGKALSEEHKANLKIARNKRAPHSEETKRKIRESMKRHFIKETISEEVQL